MKPLLETSRKGYLAAMSASSYSFVSLLQRFGPIMNPGGATLSLTYIASENVIPGYGGGMSSAKAALESDTRVLAYEAGRKYGIRVNTISAGPLGSRAARAIGFIGDMINYSMANAPLAEKELQALEVGSASAFLVSPLASAITGVTLYVDNGLHAMGVAGDSAAITSGAAAAAAAAAKARPRCPFSPRGPPAQTRSNRAQSTNECICIATDSALGCGSRFLPLRRSKRVWNPPRRGLESYGRARVGSGVSPTAWRRRRRKEEECDKSWRAAGDDEQRH